MLNSKEYENEIRAAIVAYAENLKQAGYKIENTHSYAQDEINTMKFFYENSRGNLLEASKENTVNIGNKLLSNNDYREAYAQEAVNQGESELSVQSNISRLEQEAHRDNKINPNAITNPVITNPVEEAKNDYSLMAKGRMDQTVIYEKMLNSKEYENEIRAAIVAYAENLKQAGYKIENTHSYAQDEINTMKFFYEQSKGKQLDGVKSLLVDNEKIDVTFKLNKKTGNTECHILGSNLSTFNVADRENLIEAIIKSPSVREYINKTTREDLRNGIVNLQIDEPISISIDRLEENNKAKEVSLELEI